MIGGRDAAVIVHVELFKTVKISFNLYFPRGENGSWIQNGRFCLFCQWDVQKYLCQGAVASQGSAGAACVMVGLHPAHPSALGFRLGRAWIPTCSTVFQGLPPLGAAVSLFGSCMVEVGIRNTHKFFIVMDWAAFYHPSQFGPRWDYCQENTLRAWRRNPQAAPEPGVAQKLLF